MVRVSFVQSRQPSTPLERGIYRVYQLGTIGAVLTAASFLGYLVVGMGLASVGIYDPVFVPMTLGDPVFVISAFLASTSIVVTSGCLILLTLLCGADDATSEFVIIVGLIALGCGAAAMRITIQAGSWI